MEVRRVTVYLTVKVELDVAVGTEVDEVVDELMYDFNDMSGKGKVINTDITDFEVV